MPEHLRRTSMSLSVLSWNLTKKRPRRDEIVGQLPYTGWIRALTTLGYMSEHTALGMKSSKGTTADLDKSSANHRKTTTRPLLTIKK